MIVSVRKVLASGNELECYCTGKALQIMVFALHQADTACLGEDGAAVGSTAVPWGFFIGEQFGTLGCNRGVWYEQASRRARRTARMRPVHS